MKTYRFFALALMLVVTNGQPAESSHRERYRISALECQERGFWVVAGTYSDGTMRLSWGEHDETMAADLPVRVEQHGEKRIYTVTRRGWPTTVLTVHLGLTASSGSGSFQYGDFTERSRLHCEVFAED